MASLRVNHHCLRTFLPHCGRFPCQLPQFSPVSATLLLLSVSVGAVIYRCDGLRGGLVLHPRASGPRPPTALRLWAPPSTSEGAYGSEPIPPSPAACPHQNTVLRMNCGFLSNLPHFGLYPCQPPLSYNVSATLWPFFVSATAVFSRFCHAMALFRVSHRSFLPFSPRYGCFPCQPPQFGSVFSPANGPVGPGTPLQRARCRKLADTLPVATKLKPLMKKTYFIFVIKIR